MNVYVAMNWGAWALSAVMFCWLLYDFIKTGNTYSESVLTGSVDQDGIEGQNS